MAEIPNGWRVIEGSNDPKDCITETNYSHLEPKVFGIYRTINFEKAKQELDSEVAVTMTHRLHDLLQSLKGGLFYVIPGAEREIGGLMNIITIDGYRIDPLGNPPSA